MIQSILAPRYSGLDTDSLRLTPCPFGQTVCWGTGHLPPQGKLNSINSYGTVALGTYRLETSSVPLLYRSTPDLEEFPNKTRLKKNKKNKKELQKTMWNQSLHHPICWFLNLPGRNTLPSTQKCHAHSTQDGVWDDFCWKRNLTTWSNPPENKNYPAPFWLMVPSQQHTLLSTQKLLYFISLNHCF